MEPNTPKRQPLADKGGHVAPGAQSSILATYRDRATTVAAPGPAHGSKRWTSLLPQLERGSELGEPGEVLGAASAGLASDDVRKRGDRDLETLAEGLVPGALLEIFVAVGARSGAE